MKNGESQGGNDRLREYKLTYEAIDTIENYIRSDKTKICNICGKEKKLIEFSIVRKHPDGLDYSCKECVAKRERERKEINIKNNL